MSKPQVSLADRIARSIRMDGPMPLAQFMQFCLADPHQGYYARENVLGAEGDFITAPEISQMFGELIGIWCVAAWQAIGAPAHFVLAEAGPGRGTMLADMLRAARGTSGFCEAVELVLIETSPAMIAAQRENIPDLPVEPRWTGSLQETGEGPLVLVGNEFLDALPVRQFIKTGAGWRERCVGLDENGCLQWIAGAGLAGASILPSSAAAAPVGAVFEYGQARNAWMEHLSEMLVQRGGAALIVDYGHAKAGLGDTFQAVSRHMFADPLNLPGQADLTAHVDFDALRRSAAEAGAHVSPIATQRQFLLSMGLAERASVLADAKPAHVGARIESGAARLVDENQMGSIFKVMAVTGPDDAQALAILPPFAGD